MVRSENRGSKAKREQSKILRETTEDMRCPANEIVKIVGNEGQSSLAYHGDGKIRKLLQAIKVRGVGTRTLLMMLLRDLPL
jgi:hypothetical protein